MHSRFSFILLWLVAAAIPLGEGIAEACMGLFILSVGYNARLIRLNQLNKTIFILLFTWFLSGMAAVLISGYGFLKPSELGRHSYWLLFISLMLSGTFLDKKYFSRALEIFSGFLFFAALFGLVQYVFNVHPFEHHIRPQGSGQGRLPHDSLRSVAGGFYFHRLKLAHVLVLGIGVLTARQLFQKVLRYRVLESIALATMFLALLFTFTRAALLGVAAGFLVYFLLVPWRWRLRLTGLAILCLGVMSQIQSVKDRAFSIFSEVPSDRAFMWSQALRVIKDHPLGVGLGNYSVLINKYYDQVDPTFPMRTYAHNMALSTLAETGPLGLLAWFGLWGYLAFCCVRLLKKNRAMGALGLYSLAAFFVIGLTHDVLFHHPVALAFSFILGCVLIHARNESSAGT